MCAQVGLQQCLSHFLSSSFCHWRKPLLPLYSVCTLLFFFSAKTRDLNIIQEKVKQLKEREARLEQELRNVSGQDDKISAGQIGKWNHYSNFFVGERNHVCCWQEAQRKPHWNGGKMPERKGIWVLKVSFFAKYVLVFKLSIINKISDLKTKEDVCFSLQECVVRETMERCDLQEVLLKQDHREAIE